MTELEKKFYFDMLRICDVAKKEFDYDPKIFRGMVANSGGVETAKKLLRHKDIQYGFDVLWRKKRLDLTMEAHVIKTEYVTLFTEDEINETRNRLIAHEYTF
ncbi:hypothetical protein [Pelosinus sp. sgz500959]|uniref:hypothetical protein n=1 Tax=Pelosinus sp. sgz500959 TaxID=3242472 RepID=UPI00366DDC29